MSAQSAEIELSHRAPLPPSISTGFISSEAPNHGNPSFSTEGIESLGHMNETALPPVDGGFGAWSFLAACFVVETIVWGFGDAYGVFLSAYLQDPRYASQKGATTLLPLVGALASGISYCSGIFFTPIAARYPHHLRKSMLFGVFLCFGGLFTASYATEIYQLILFQGVIYAVGGSLVYLPCISYMSEWFVARRGMANGIFFAGTAAGGLLLPLVLPPLMARYGLHKTLRILAATIGLVLLPLMPFLKGRLPHNRVRVHGPSPRGALGPQQWMKQISFWVFLAVNTIQAFAYFVPIVYLPTFATQLHLSSSNSALTLSVLNAASLVGRLLVGYLSDKVNPWVLALTTLFTTSVATFVLWGVLSHTFAGLLAFGVVYGSVAGGWSSTWTGFVKMLAKDDPAMATTLFSYLLLTRGVGSIASTPISAKLYSQIHNATGGLERTGFDVGHGRFGKMIVYVGTCFAGAAGVAAVGWAMDHRKRRQNGRGVE